MAEQKTSFVDEPPNEKLKSGLANRRLSSSKPAFRRISQVVGSATRRAESSDDATDDEDEGETVEKKSPAVDGGLEPSSSSLSPRSPLRGSSIRRVPQSMKKSNTDEESSPPVAGFKGLASSDNVASPKHKSGTVTPITNGGSPRASPISESLNNFDSKAPDATKEKVNNRTPPTMTAQAGSTTPGSVFNNVGESGRASFSLVDPLASTDGGSVPTDSYHLGGNETPETQTRALGSARTTALVPSPFSMPVPLPTQAASCDRPLPAIAPPKLGGGRTPLPELSIVPLPADTKEPSELDVTVESSQLEPAAKNGRKPRVMPNMEEFGSPGDFHDKDRVDFGNGMVDGMERRLTKEGAAIVVVPPAVEASALADGGMDRSEERSVGFSDPDAPIVGFAAELEVKSIFDSRDGTDQLTDGSRDDEEEECIHTPLAEHVATGTSAFRQDDEELLMEEENRYREYCYKRQEFLEVHPIEEKEFKDGRCVCWVLGVFGLPCAFSAGLFPKQTGGLMGCAYHYGCLALLCFFITVPLFFYENEWRWLSLCLDLFFCLLAVIFFLIATKRRKLFVEPPTAPDPSLYPKLTARARTLNDAAVRQAARSVRTRKSNSTYRLKDISSQNGNPMNSTNPSNAGSGNSGEGDPLGLTTRSEAPQYQQQGDDNGRISSHRGSDAFGSFLRPRRGTSSNGENNFRQHASSMSIKTPTAVRVDFDASGYSTGSMRTENEEMVPQSPPESPIEVSTADGNVRQPDTPPPAAAWVTPTSMSLSVPSGKY